jgi:steroid 5-alpha reductase family enzyme
MIQHPYLIALFVMLVIAVVSWLCSIIKKDVSFVDSLWSLFFLAAALIFALEAQALSLRANLVLALVIIWSLRLSIYITARNWGEPEDYRYQSIRQNNEPGFTFKSLYIVFVLQGFLAWLVAMPLLPAITSNAALSALDILAAMIWLVGFVFEAGGDYQLARFKSREDSHGRVLDTGLWRFTRHPNYFGEFCMWWAFYLFAVASGGWWTIVSPLLLSFLLLRVSGVAMLEATINDRRPEYAEYIRRTNAFFPGAPVEDHRHSRRPNHEN